MAQTSYASPFLNFFVGILLSCFVESLRRDAIRRIRRRSKAHWTTTNKLVTTSIRCIFFPSCNSLFYFFLDKLPFILAFYSHKSFLHFIISTPSCISFFLLILPPLPRSCSLLAQQYKFRKKRLKVITNRSINCGLSTFCPTFQSKRVTVFSGPYLYENVDTHAAEAARNNAEKGPKIFLQPWDIHVN